MQCDPYSPSSDGTERAASACPSATSPRLGAWLSAPPGGRSHLRVRSCCRRAWAPEEALIRCTLAARPAWLCLVGAGLPAPACLAGACPGLASQGAGGIGAREELGAERPGVWTPCDTKSRAARSLRLLPAPQGPPLGDAARALPRGGGSANKLGSSSGGALRSLRRATAPGTVSRAHARALRD